MKAEKMQAKVRRITVKVPDELYARVIAAKLFSHRTIGDLTCEGLRIVAQRYREERRVKRDAEQTASVTNRTSESAS